MELLILGVIKFIDNSISTCKNILLYKGRYILSSFMVFLSTLIFCFVVSGISKANSLPMIITISVSSALGSLITSFISYRFEKDKTYINIITCSDLEEIKYLHEYLTDHKIKHILLQSYNLDWEPNLSIEIFAKTKQQSKIIDNFIKNNETKFLREIIE